MREYNKHYVRLCMVSVVMMVVAQQVFASTASPKLLKLQVGGVTFELVRIPAGQFRMGSEAGDNDERPVHRVHIKESFYFGKTEATMRQFRAFTKSTGYKTEAEKGRWAWNYAWGFPVVPAHDISWRKPGFAQSEDNPAVCISWNDAVAFCRWLSKETGEHYRLSSEAEWEYACRAGSDNDDKEEEIGWYRNDSGGATHPVGQKKPNAWGLYDVHGNVWEWCLDMWHGGYEGAPHDGSAWMEAKTFEPVMRGGSFVNPPWWLRSANHMRNNPGNRFSYNQGIRLVRVVEPPK